MSPSSVNESSAKPVALERDVRRRTLRVPRTKRPYYYRRRHQRRRRDRVFRRTFCSPRQTPLRARARALVWARCTTRARRVHRPYLWAILICHVSV